ncbi:MAG TPA: aminotransferase class V-fold PLP-dependent enzyme [Ktedonobacteraceae bacterium]|nr:aminotransferase class V-fold PLP-dependent enzyme [Ktedonobacteraceae bacterium]
MTDLTHVQRIRQAMPATTRQIYLNTGTFGPLPEPAIQAIQAYFEKQYQQGRIGADAFEEMGNTYNSARTSAAHLLHANDGEIALTDNTGEGLNIISFGLDWREGDEVITTNHEHISALAPLYQLRDRYGIVIRMADIGPVAERPAEAAIAELITPRTRLIVLSHVAWTTGAVLNVGAVGALGREHGIPVLVDGAQSAGAIPIDVKALDVDFYAIPMQKWLCGPDGTGALYTRRESLPLINCTYVGYFSIKHEEDVEWALNDNALRFELGGRQTAAIAGQTAVLNWLEQTVGHEWLFERISSLNTYACQALQTVPGLTLLTPQPGASGLASFTLADQDVTTVVEQLREKHNILIRSIPSMKSLRISTGFYNTEGEIDAVVKALRGIVA